MHLLGDDDFRAILADVTFPDFSFAVVQTAEGAPALQIQCDGTDNVTGEQMTWKSRKWLLSRHATRGEVVQTAFLATMTALEHEARETFLYQGASIFDPHYDVDKLVELRRRPDALKERAPLPAADFSAGADMGSSTDA